MPKTGVPESTSRLISGTAYSPVADDVQKQSDIPVLKIDELMVRDAEQMDEMHGRMKGTVYMNLGNAKLEELSPQIQAAMKNSQPGDVAMPFQSEAGVELIARCDQRVVQQTAYVMPTRQEVEDQLFQNQIAALARRYLRDLKRAANIQVRDDSKPDALIR